MTTPILNPIAANTFLINGNLFINEFVSQYSWIDFLNVLGNQENSGSYDIQKFKNGTPRNPSYSGIYQEGDSQLGYDQFFSGIGGQLLGVTTRDQLAHNPIAQELDGISEFSGTP
ncbi:MAG TPA: hypothetical protein VIE91_03750 [Methylophilaceae bacterium]|jgi:hypothetical protein